MDKKTYLIVLLLVSISCFLSGVDYERDNNTTQVAIKKSEIVKSETEKPKWQYSITENIKVFNCTNKTQGNKFYNKLQSRKGKIYIEIVRGTVLDDDGNGKDNSGFYIAYDTKKFKKGDKVESVFIYNPNNNYTDDIISRTDILIDEEEWSNE